MTSTSQRRLAASSGALLLTLAVFVLLVSIAQAARPTLSQLQRAHGGHGGTSVAYAPAPSTPVAGTEGRGGVAAAASTSTSGTPATRSTAAVRSAVGAPLGGRGALVGRGRVPVAAATTTTNGGWIAGGVAVAAFLIGLLFWGLSRGARRADEVASVTSIGEASAQRASSPSQQQSERKAA